MELHTVVENHNRKQIAPRFELCSVCAPILARGPRPEGLQLFRTPVVQEPQTGERRRGARLRAAAVPARLNSTRTSSAQPVQTHSKGTRRGCAQPPLETTARNAGGPKRIATQHIWNSPTGNLWDSAPTCTTATEHHVWGGPAITEVLACCAVWPAVSAPASLRS